MRKLVLPDEDRFEIPEVWRTTLHPRRGGLPGPEVPVPPDAGERFRAWLTSEKVLKHRKEMLPPERGVTHDPVLLAEGTHFLRTWLESGDSTGTTPRAAAVGVLMSLSYARPGRTEAFHAVDAWISRHGVVFAACAAAELAGLVGEDDSAFWTHDPARPDYTLSWHWEDLASLVATARAVRSRLAVATDDDYEQARQALSGYRIAPGQRMVTSYLMPTEVAWVDEDCAADWPDMDQRRGFLVLAASGVHHLEQLRDRVSDRIFGYYRTEIVGTVLEGVGPAATPILVEPFYRDLLKLGDDYRSGSRLGPDGARLLAATPTDDALRLLCRFSIGSERARPGVLMKSGALTRFPVRALRVLHELESAPLSTHEHEYRKHQEVSNPDELAIYSDLLGRQVLADPRLTAAAADLLPADVRERVEGIVATGGAGLGAGLAGLLDRHHAQGYSKFLDSADDERRAVGALATIAADDAFGHLLDRVDRTYVRPALLAAAKRDPGRALRVLLAKATGGTAAELLHNHVLAYPDAVTEALPALDEHARARVEAILGDAVAGMRDDEGATPEVLAGPPRGTNGKAMRVPELPDWLVLPELPAVALRDGGETLSPNAVRALCGLLAVSKIAAPHTGIVEVRALCEPHNLAAFAWEVFRQWRAAHYPPKSGLAMTALALLGDDSVVAGLAELFPSWAKGSSGRVRTGMDVLAVLGTEGALRELHRLARKAKTKGFRRLAEQRLDDVARARGLSPEQLADRLVPDLGLDADARTTLDYGPRHVVVGFDAQFTPHLTDQDGKRLTRMPRPAATDDAELAAAATKRYTALKKEVLTVVKERTGALEVAMTSGRRWSEPDFRRLFLEHPLMWRLAQRLLWATFDERDAVVTTFRPAEDRTFADLDDKTVELDAAATVGLAHPWHFAADRAEWATVFTDYEIIQPFPQVGRELLTLPESDADRSELTRFVGRSTASRKEWVLAARGWLFNDNNTALSREWPGGRIVEIGFHGYSFHDPDAPDELTGVRVVAAHGTGTGPATFADLDPIAASEVLRDLEYLVS